MKEVKLSLKTVQSTRVSGLTSKSTALAFRFGLTALDMKAIGLIIKLKARVSSGM